MSYGNYVQGAIDTANNGYNLLISGAPSGYTQSGLMIGGDTGTMYGARVATDATNNVYVDMRADANNTMSMRYQDNASGAITSMLDLSNDSSLTGSGYGAIVNGRVNASSYYVGQVDTRAPSNTGVYVSMDGSNIGQFNINKGSGSGGFQFNTFNANGTLQQNNMTLNASGTVTVPYYANTGNAGDSEEVAIAGFDSNGNLVRNFGANMANRARDARIAAIEADLISNLPDKMNEVITRVNGLNFFSQNIETIAIYVPPHVSPSPVPNNGGGGGGSGGGPSGCTLNVGGTVAGNTYTIWNSGGDIQFLLGTAEPWYNGGNQVDMLYANTGLTFTIPAGYNPNGYNASQLNLGFQVAGQPGYSSGYYIIGGNYWADDSAGLSATIKLYDGACMVQPGARKPTVAQKVHPKLMSSVRQR